MDSNGPTCGLGHHGCASAYLPSASIVTAIGVEGLDYPGAVELARAGDPAATRAFDAAARALGLMIGTIINGLDPERIVLTGDGLAVMDISGDEVMRAIDATRLPSDLPIPLDVQPFEFTEWARAGAVVAIRRLLRF